MTDMKRTNQINLLSKVTYVLSMLLFFEWIRPLNQIVDFDHLDIFVLFTLLSFGIMLFNLRSWLSPLLKTIALLVIVQVRFLPRPIMSNGWLSFIEQEFRTNLSALLARNWFQFTELFQTLIFLMIIALVSYLLYFWFVTMRRVFVYICLTIVYVGVMDTFTVYQADRAIIWVMMISIFILAINHYLKRIITKQLSVDLAGWFLRTIIPLILVMLTIGTLSYFAPKSDPIWPDPVGFVRSASEQVITNGRIDELGRSGYSPDDSRLGGSMLLDDTPIFHAETSIEHYWRVESKDYYTGKGWQQDTGFNFDRYREGDLQLIEQSTLVDLTEASVQYTEQVNFLNLVYPYGLVGVDHELTDFFEHDPETGQINPIFSEQVFNTFELLYHHPIELTYSYPNISDQQLRKAGGAIPHQIASNYLQLPATLPDRVYQLASDLIAGEETQYDQAVAIERYFSRGNFSYQTEDVPYPAAGQDYVDQFLFETQYGYCDNFSTSMVVLLRAVGIPARWVKGFSSGEQVADLSTDSQELYRYEIKNSNAHSWVEVYFPNIGWIPFEPTIGLNGSDMLYSEDDQSSDREIIQRDQPINQMGQDMLTEETDEEDLVDHELRPTRSLGKLSIWFWLAGLTVVLIILGVLAIRWKQFLTKLILWRWSAFRTNQDFETAYLGLFKLLQLHQLKRRPDQTLHDFAREVDQTLATDLMTRLTDAYTQLIYRKDFQLENKSSHYEDYQAMIKRILT